ncbi:MAG: hypothetical protein WDN26_13355 [Chitinophagaceae bacterium]
MSKEDKENYEMWKRAEQEVSGGGDSDTKMSSLNYFFLKELIPAL